LHLFVLIHEIGITFDTKVFTSKLGLNQPGKHQPTGFQGLFNGDFATFDTGFQAFSHYYKSGSITTVVLPEYIDPKVKISNTKEEIQDLEAELENSNTKGNPEKTAIVYHKIAEKKQTDRKA